MFQLIFRESAAKKLAKMDEPYFSLIKEGLLELSNDYFPGGKNCKRLKGKNRDYYRIRIGVYRVIYYVDHARKTLTILRIFHRGEGY